MKKRGLLFAWLVAKSVIIGFVILLIGANYLFGGFRNFWFDNSAPLNVIKREMIEVGDVDKRDKEGFTALMLAAAADDSRKNQEVVKLLVQEGGANVNLKAIKPDPIGNTPLHQAATRGNPNIVKYLLTRNANPMMLNKNKAAPIHLASRCQNDEKLLKMVEDFIAWGVGINFPDKRKKMPVIFWVLDFGPSNITAFELLQKKYPHFIDYEMRIGGITKTVGGKTKTVGGKTLKAFAKEKLEDDYKESLVKPAILQKWRPEIDPNAFDKRYSFNENFTISMVAAIKGKTKELETLVKHGANLNLADKKYGNFPLNWALIYNRPKVVDVIVKNKGNANAKNKARRYPIHYLYGILKKSDKKKVAKSLFKYGADFNAQDNDGNTFLHRAVLLADNELVKLITTDKYFKARVNFNLKNKRKRTALDIAKKYKDKEMIKMLKPFEKDTLTKKEKKDKFTLFMKAVMRGDLKAVKALLKKSPAEVKKEINKKNRKKDTALHFALRFRHPKIALLLIEKGAKIKPNRKKNTPLHEVVNISDSELRNKIAKMLVEKGADVLEENRKGDTVLHLAVQKNQPELIKFLKDNFGKISKNKKGKTVLDLAKEQGKQDIVDLLQGKK